MYLEECHQNFLQNFHQMIYTSISAAQQKPLVTRQQTKHTNIDNSPRISQERGWLFKGFVTFHVSALYCM